MATTKTLTPTNETITIDAFQGEKPDHRHVADAETKLADAINALNSQTAKVKNFGMVQIQATLTNSVTIGAGDSGKIFDNVNLKTGNVFSSFSIGTQAYIPDKVTGIILLWASGGNCLPNDQIAWASGAVTLGVKNVGSTSATLTAVRLLLFGTYN